MLSTLGVAILLLLEGPFQEKPDPVGPVQSQVPSQLTLKQSTARAQRVPSLNQDSLDEIRQIRDRIGLRLFPGKKNELEFESQLRKLGEGQSSSTKNIENRRPHPLATGSSSPPLVEPTPPANVAHSLLTLRSLFAAVENLDKEALQLEQTGEFEKSKKLRKLSRRIQKQIQQMVKPRDN